MELMKNRLKQIDRWALILFAISLVVRLAFTLPVSLAGVPTVGDEGDYYEWAEDIHDVIVDSIADRQIDPELLRTIYGTGRWPPFFSLVLAGSFLLSGKSLLAARVTVTVISAATTSIVYLLAKKLTTPRAAIFAALGYICLPPFIAFAHFLWSETLFIFFVLLTVYFSLQVVEPPEGRPPVLYAILTGASLGLAGLTRASVLLFLVVFPGWLFFKLNRSPWRQRILLPALTVLVAAAALLPWEAALYHYERHFVLLSTVGTANLYKGNNQFVREGFSTVDGMNEERIALQYLNDYVEREGVSKNAAFQSLARQEIIEHPFLFIERSFYRVRMMWSVDNYVLRHFMRGAYPPVSNAFLGILWGVFLCSYLLYCGAAVLGLVYHRPVLKARWLIIFLILANTAIPAISVGVTRFNLISLALMTPAFGYGVDSIKSTRRPERAAAIGTMALLAYFSFASIPEVMMSMHSSSQYAPIVNLVNTLYGTDTDVVDKIELQLIDPGYSDEIIISLGDEGYRIIETDETEITWATDENQKAYLRVYAVDPTGPLTIRLTSQRSGESAAVQPINRDSWGGYQPTGLDSIDYTWVAGIKTLTVQQ